MARRRITISFNSELPEDQMILDYLTALPRRTRSEIIKEIIHDALADRPSDAAIETPQQVTAAATEEIDPDKLIESLF